MRSQQKKSFHSDANAITSYENLNVLARIWLVNTGTDTVLLWLQNTSKLLEMKRNDDHNMMQRILIKFCYFQM